MLKLPFKLEKSDVQEHLEVMFAKFMEEKKKEKASKWNWMGQLQEKSLKKAKFLKISLKWTERCRDLNIYSYKKRFKHEYSCRESVKLQ